MRSYIYSSGSDVIYFLHDGLYEIQHRTPELSSSQEHFSHLQSLIVIDTSSLEPTLTSHHNPQLHKICILNILYAIIARILSVDFSFLQDFSIPQQWQ